MLRHPDRLEEADKQLSDNGRPVASLDLDENQHDESPIECNYDADESKLCGSSNETTKRNEVPQIPQADKRTLQKFIEGDEILDQKNPFKSDDEFDHARVIDDLTPSCTPDCNDDDEEETDFITKEEILRQSKYVKTYVKNPDKLLNYDKSVIERMDAIRATGHEVKDVIVLSPARPPIPAPRKINCHSSVESKKTYTYNDKIRSLPHGNISRAQQNTVKPIPLVRRDYCDLKVRVGSAELEESLYDSNEVVQNALKFDSRFRTVEFGSQDDIDTIAEKTDSGGTVLNTSLQSDIPSDSIPSTPVLTVQPNPNESDLIMKKKESCFAEEVKKSFSNTIKSADFRKYLQSRGLTLVPTSQKQKYDANASGTSLQGSSTTTAAPAATKQRQPTKLAVLSKFLQSNLFSPKTAYSPMLQRSSTPMLNPNKPTNRSISVGSNTSSHIGRSHSLSAKPKVSFRELEYRNTHDAKEANNGQFATMDFNRSTRLRTSFAGRPSTSNLDPSSRRSMRNAGVQVNLERSKNAPGDLPAHLVESSSPHEIPLRQQIGPRKVPLQRHLPVEKYSTLERKTVAQDFDLKGYAASAHTVVPVYSEPLRCSDPINYHIYEQTPDNLNRDMLYGHIGYIGSSQLSGWLPHNRRSYSSVQEAPTYGRLRSAHVSSPLSTQSTPVRCTSETLDRQQILHKIYDFYRRSIRSSKSQNVKANDSDSILHNEAGASSGHRIIRSEEHPREQHCAEMENVPVTHVVQVRSKPSVSVKEPVNTPQQTQYDRNIENIYSFVNKKLNQLRVHEANGHRIGSTGSIRNASILPRRVMFSNSSYNNGSNCTAQPLNHEIGEADYVNIRGPPDGIQYRTSHW